MTCTHWFASIAGDRSRAIRYTSGRYSSAIADASSVPDRSSGLRCARSTRTARQADTHLHRRGAGSCVVPVCAAAWQRDQWLGWSARLSGTTIRVPRRSIALFIGNVVAAAAGLRALPDQQDFNRIWRNATGPGAALAAAVQAALADHELFAAIDLHNNTGHNPYYSVVTDLDARNFGLALMFSEQAVYVEEPDTVLTRMFAGRCPAITLEVGPVGDERCTARVYDLHRSMPGARFEVPRKCRPPICGCSARAPAFTSVLESIPLRGREVRRSLGGKTGWQEAAIAQWSHSL